MGAAAWTGLQDKRAVLGFGGAGVGQRVLPPQDDKARDSGRDTLAWAREVQDRGAGEIVLNCMASDGVAPKANGTA